MAELMVRAYACQTAGDLDQAERLYRTALSLGRNNFDALHMLGVICLQKGNAEEAVRLLMSAMPLLQVEYPPFFRNLILALGAVARKRSPAGAAQGEEPGEAFLGFFRGAPVPLPRDLPRVSIVVPGCNEAAYTGATIASAAEQSYANLELIVVDDGSRDASAECIKQALSEVPLPHRFFRCDQQSVHAALNDCIAGASGDYVAILPAGDRFTPHRTENMVRMLVDRGARWGISNIDFVDAASVPIRFGDKPGVDAIMRSYDSLYSCRAVSEFLLDNADALLTGTLFFERTLLREIGGFQNYRYHAGWAFGLHAALHAEPAYLDEPAYVRRTSGDEYSAAERSARDLERDVVRTRVEVLFESLKVEPNSAFARALERRRARDLALIARGAGHLIDRSRLLGIAAELGFAAPIG